MPNDIKDNITVLMQQSWKWSI